VLHLRHFNRGLQVWEGERDGPITLPLKTLGTDRVVFADDSRPQPPHRMTYLRDGEAMIVRIESNTGEANEFRFTREG
jgi:hypothetical protein